MAGARRLCDTRYLWSRIMGDGGGGQGNAHKGSGSLTDQGDPSISHPLQTFAAGPQGNIPIGQGFATAAAENAPVTPANIFNTATAFAPETTATTGVGGPTVGESPFA